MVWAEEAHIFGIVRIEIIAKAMRVLGERMKIR